jgi:DNA mismatch repair protein MutS
MSKSSDQDTPIRRQYLDIKRQYPDAILFFRLGDFYETFDEDAHTVSRVLDIVLTSRNVAKGVRVPMAGIPHHAAENYLSRLIDQGFHVAICEQVGDTPIRGLVPRQVVRVITPGTILEPGLLPGDSNNYLACLVPGENQAGVAYADITTGEFAATEIASGDLLVQLRAELARFKPAEIVHPDSIKFNGELPGFLTPWPAWRFEHARCQQVLKDHFGVATLDGFGLRGLPLAEQAAGALIQYLGETQPASLALLQGLNTYTTSEFMTLDAATRRNLELTETLQGSSGKGSLLGVLDSTITPMGKRLIRQWVSKPLLDVDAIRLRQEGVAALHDHGLLRATVRSRLKPLGDLERITNRIVSASAQPRDLVALRSFLQQLPQVVDCVNDPVLDGNPAVEKQRTEIQLCEDALELLEHAVAEDPPSTLQNVGVFNPGYSAELDGIIERSRHAREWIANLEAVERERTGIKSLKVGYNRVFGYYIEVTRTHSSQVPDAYIRKQTLVNAERYITPEMKEYETLVLNAEERIREIENRLFAELCARIAIQAPRLLATGRVLGEVDVFASLAEVATLNQYTRPQVEHDDILEVLEGRHPVVERTLSGERFVPNDVVFAEGERIRIITGPNMSGKSTYLRQVALIILLAQMGSYVPAQSARIGLVDRIFTRIGAQDEIHAGQSTFMVEMVETANILHHASRRSLLVLDEIGRGTSTYDGLSIAWAVVEYIHNHPELRAKTLFATHFHELTQLADLLPGVSNYNVAVSDIDDQVVFLHRIVPGGADRSYGIHVAQLAGLPPAVIQRANEILKQLEASSGKAVRINPHVPKQMALFPETNPLLTELKQIDLNALSPIEALTRLYEWKKRYLDSSEDHPA